MRHESATSRFRPSRDVISALRVVRSQGLARKLGTIDADLIELLQRGGDHLESNFSYIEDTAAHWGRAGMRLDDADKDTDYTRSLRKNVTIGKITDESGALLERYRGTPLEPGLAGWLTQVNRYADNPSLARMNVAYGVAHVAEHVDPPDQNMIQCLVEGETVFEFRTPTGSHVFELNVGDVWWFNTTWPHRTRIPRQGRRLLLHTRAALRAEYLDRPETPPDRLIARSESREGAAS